MNLNLTLKSLGGRGRKVSVPTVFVCQYLDMVGEEVTLKHMILNKTLQLNAILLGFYNQRLLSKNTIFIIGMIHEILIFIFHKTRIHIKNVKHILEAIRKL